MLLDLAKWEQRPSCLTTMAYELCSAILENYPSLADGQNLLCLSLQVGFRHLDPQNPRISAKLTHTEYHPHMVDIVFGNGDDEEISDLLHAWTSRGDCHKPPESLNTCARHLVGLRPSSQRLRRLVIRAIGCIGYGGFEGVGLEEFFELLNHLGATVEETDDKEGWATLLLDTVKSSEGIRRLTYPYWEFLIELLIGSEPRVLDGAVWCPRVITSLEGDQEWDKLECWMGVIWVAWPPETGTTAEEDARRVMLSLLCQRPGAVSKLEKWVGRWSERCGRAVPETFQRMCEQTRTGATRQDVP